MKILHIAECAGGVQMVSLPDPVDLAENDTAPIMQNDQYLFLWGETFGLSVAEAKSYGIPCIVPDRCAAAEQVEDGKTGFIFNTGNLDSLKEAILKYEQADIAKMQQTLIDTFDAKSLSMETHVKNLLEIYNQILAKN